MGSIGEFFVDLGVKADTFTVKDFAKSLADMPLYAAGAVTALAGIDLGMLALANHTINMANNINMFSAETGLSTQELQRWQNAAKQVGMTGDEVTSSLMGISNAVVQITRFGNAGPAIAFGRLGISDWASKSPFEIFQELRGRYGKMNPNEFRTYASQLGVSPEMMRLFGMPEGQFNQAMAVGPTMNDGQLRAMSDFQGELARFTQVIEKSFVPVMTAVTPYLGDLARNLGELLKQSAPIIGATVGATAEAAGYWQHPVTGMVGFFESIRDLIDLGVANMANKGNDVNITQHIHGVTNIHDADKVGARELTHAAKQIPRGH